MDTNKVDHHDWKIIVRLGGPAKVARLLGYDVHGGTQRVQNWRYRGIPSDVKLAFPDIFLRELTRHKSRLRTGPSDPQEVAKGETSDAGAAIAVS